MPKIKESIKLYERVRGLQISEPIVEESCRMPWGEYKAVFIDPDGNEFNLTQV